MTELQQGHFALFGLPERFALDEAALEQAYRQVQSQVHPDRFAAAGPAEKRVAMQWATRANEAVRTLRSPVARAAYLCERNGQAIDAESNTAMPPEFLMQQMQWREDLEEARSVSRPEEVQALVRDVEAHRDQTLAEVAAALDERHDYVAAASGVRQLFFIDRFRAELAAFLDTEHTATSGQGQH